MKQLISLQDFIIFWNFEVNLADDIEDPEALEIVKDVVYTMILDQCGIEDPPIRFINARCQIEEVKKDENSV